MAQIASKTKALGELMKSMVPVSEIKASVVQDVAFINKVAEMVATKMIAEGLIEDKLMTAKEAREYLGIKSPMTFNKLVGTSITPIRLTGKNGHPRFKMSDLNKIKTSK